MEIVAVTCKIDSAVKFGIVFCCLVFELKGEGEVLLYVGVGKIVQSAFGCGVAQSIVKKYLSSWFSIAALRSSSPPAMSNCSFR